MALGLGSAPGATEATERGKVMEKPAWKPKKPMDPERLAFFDGMVVGSVGTLFLTVVVILWWFR